MPAERDDDVFALGTVRFCTGAYVLAAAFDLDRAVLRWVKHHM